MRFAPNTLTLFNDLDPLNQLIAIKKCGFDYIEFLFPYLVSVGKAKSLIEAFNLRISLIDVLAGDVRKYDISAAINPERQEEYRKYAQLAVQYASELEVPYINCIAGVPSTVESTSREIMLEQYKENLAYTCDLFKDTGKTVLIETVSGFQFPGYLLNSLEEVISIMNELNRPNLGLLFDFFHIQLLHGNLSGNVKKYYNRIKYFQAANPPGRNQPGVGEINFSYLINMIKDMGYDGFVGLEYEPDGKSEESFGWLEEFS